MRRVEATVNIAGLEALVEQKIEEVLARRECDPWLTTPEAAAYLCIAPGTVRNLVCSDRLPRHGTPGTRLRFRRSELDAYAETR
jgi:excisionase family DNA binding protein